MTSIKDIPLSVSGSDQPDPVDDAIPLDEIDGDAIQPTDPEIVTALDDDEGGADAIDPETGRPYDNTDPGVNRPTATRKGSMEEQ